MDKAENKNYKDPTWKTNAAAKAPENIKEENAWKAENKNDKSPVWKSRAAAEVAEQENVKGETNKSKTEGVEKNK